MQSATDQFYSALPVSDLPLGNLFMQPALFHNIPADWHIILTDIRNSTIAVKTGKHETVNLIATGSIVAVLNIALGMAITVPFFFGGDGATFVVPPSVLQPAMNALAAYRLNTFTNFELDLRTATLPVSEVYANGHALRVCKFSKASRFAIPVMLGDGLDYAEKRIKAADPAAFEPLQQTEQPDLSGMECRWDRIAPPHDQDEIVSLLVIPARVELQADVFREVMNKLDEIYGPSVEREPISVNELRLKTTFSRMGTEMRVRLGRVRAIRLLARGINSILVRLYLKTRKGKGYLKRLVEMSDTLVIDGRINTVISGTTGKRQQLESFLSAMESEGRLWFGLHLSSASVMSCYVRDLDDGHIHFVDGSEGGYTEAAKMLKRKLAALQPEN